METAESLPVLHIKVCLGRRKSALAVKPNFSCDSQSWPEFEIVADPPNRDGRLLSSNSQIRREKKKSYLQALFEVNNKLQEKGINKYSALFFLICLASKGQGHF